MNFFIVANAIAIMAIGRSERGAVRDYCKQTGDHMTVGELSRDSRSGKLYLQRCTERLYDYVRFHGTPSSWDETSYGVADLIDKP